MTYKKGHGRRGRHNSPEHNRAISTANKGRRSWRAGKRGFVVSDETRLKISQKAKARYAAAPPKLISDETRARISAAARARALSSPETRAKISATLRARGPLSEATKANMSAAQRARRPQKPPVVKVPRPRTSRGPCLATTKAKISAANSGPRNGMYQRPQSASTRKAIGEASRQHWTDPTFRARRMAWLSSEEGRQAMRRARASVVLPSKDTKPEKKIQALLDGLRIAYVKHLYMDIQHAYQCDVYIPSIHVVIECDGRYWHKWPHGRDIDRVRTSELIAKGYGVLRLWEHEIYALSTTNLLQLLTAIAPDPYGKNVKDYLLKMEREAC